MRCDAIRQVGIQPFRRAIAGVVPGKDGREELRDQRRCVDARWPSNMAPIGAKLCQNAFLTISVNAIFGNFCLGVITFSAFVFRVFDPVLEALHTNGPQTQLLRSFLL